MAEVITDPQLRTFVHSSVSKSFGLTVDQVATKCKSYGRFAAWLNGDTTQIKEVLNKVKSNGVSPAFFAAYERTEGYNSKWGWLNHTSVNGSPVTDADSVSKWVVTQSNNTTDKPAWIDFANYNDFVPENVKQAGNADFANMKKGSIGKVVIAGTAAATWEVYYPLGLKKEYNGVQDYGKPITNMMNTIIEWGGSLSSDDGSGGGGGGENPDPEPKPPEIDFSGILKFFTDFGKDIVNKIEKMLIVNLFDYGKSRTFGNSFLRVDKTFANTYKIKPTLNFDKAVDDIIKKGKQELEKITEDLKPKDPAPDPDPGDGDGDDGGSEPSGDMYFPVNINQAGVNFWVKENHPVGSIQNDMGYGRRASGEFHSGYDIGTGGNAGYKAYAIRDCTITDIRQVTGGGYSIFMKHETDKYHSMFLHLQQDSAVVKVGDKVKAGQQVAVIGNTGGNYAIHLHVEISPTGAFHNEANTINPQTYLKVTGDNKTSLKIPK